MKFLSALTIAFIVLKLTGYIAWSWFLVLLPMLIPLILVLVFLLIVTILYYFDDSGRSLKILNRITNKKKSYK